MLRSRHIWHHFWLRSPLGEPGCGNAGKGEPKALVSVSHACTCRQGFLLAGWGNLDRTRPRPHAGSHKTVLVLHDDFQHLGQTRRMITIAEGQPVSLSAGAPDQGLREVGYGFAALGRRILCARPAASKIQIKYQPMSICHQRSPKRAEPAFK